LLRFYYLDRFLPTQYIMMTYYMSLERITIQTLFYLYRNTVIKLSEDEKKLVFNKFIKPSNYQFL